MKLSHIAVISISSVYPGNREMYPRSMQYEIAAPVAPNRTADSNPLAAIWPNISQSKYPNGPPPVFRRDLE